MVDWVRWIRNNWVHNRRFAIWTVAILAFLVRLVPSFVLATYAFNTREDHWAFGFEWGRIAKWLLAINTFSLDGVAPTSTWDPLYVFIIAPFFHIFGTYTIGAAIALITFQSLLCALSTWLLFVLAERLYGPFEARMSALLFACYPASIFFAISRIAPSSLVALLLCTLFLVVLSLQRSQQRRLAVIGGVLMGLLALTSSKTLSLVAVVPIWLILTSKTRRVSALVCSLILIGTAVLTTVPWSIRNAVTLGHFSMSRADIGYQLWVGNNPDAAANWFASREALAETLEGKHFSQRQFLQMAVSWAVHHPQAFARLTLERIKYFWYRIGDRGERTRDMWQTWISVIILGLALSGLFWSGEQFDRVSLLLLMLALYPMVFYLTHMSAYRYRYPIEPFLLILASRGLHFVWQIVYRKGVMPQQKTTLRPIHAVHAGSTRQGKSAQSTS